ncbi:MAG: hypothetical protein ABII02_03620 [Candidatus Magasanikbacteria bacterium]
MKKQKGEIKSQTPDAEIKEKKKDFIDELVEDTKPADPIKDLEEIIEKVYPPDYTKPDDPLGEIEEALDKSIEELKL